MSRITVPLSALSILFAALQAPASAQTGAMAPDIAATKFEAAIPGADYVKKVVMIPMRDGVRLYTMIVVPKGAQRAPIMLTRTPSEAVWLSPVEVSCLRLQHSFSATACTEISRHFYR